MPYALKRLLASPHAWLAAGLFGLLAVVAHVVSFNAMSAWTRAWQLWISVAVLVAYGRFGYEALVSRRMARDQQLALGICTSFLFSLLTAVTIVYWRFVHPGELLDSNWINVFIAMQGVGGLLHITAPGALNAQTPMRNWIVLGLAAATVITLAVVLVSYRLGPGI